MGAGNRQPRRPRPPIWSTPTSPKVTPIRRKFHARLADRTRRLALHPPRHRHHQRDDGPRHIPPHRREDDRSTTAGHRLARRIPQRPVARDPRVETGRRLCPQSGSHDRLHGCRQDVGGATCGGQAHPCARAARFVARAGGHSRAPLPTHRPRRHRSAPRRHPAHQPAAHPLRQCRHARAVSGEVGDGADPPRKDVQLRHHLRHLSPARPPTSPRYESNGGGSGLETRVAQGAAVQSRAAGSGGDRVRTPTPARVPVSYQAARRQPDPPRLRLAGLEGRHRGRRPCLARGVRGEAP